VRRIRRLVGAFRYREERRRPCDPLPLLDEPRCGRAGGRLHRRRGRRPARAVPLKELPARVGPPFFCGCTQGAVRREQSVLLAEALDNLPPDYREVIILRNLQGLSFPEVAQRMSRSVDSVTKLWARALVQLRRHLGGQP
jgi:RNA polymerase sigma factor (sigma-70 family)